MNEQERKEVVRRQRIQRARDNFGIDSSLFYKYRLENFELLPGNEEALDLAKGYAWLTDDFKVSVDDAWWDKHPIYHHFLTFVGDCGRGKTHLALGIGIAKIELFEESVIYYQVADLLCQMRASFEDKTKFSFSEILARCKNTELLILDDLGMQKNTDWAIEQLDSIVDFRYINQLETVFTTNVKPDRLPPRMSSRIREGEIACLTCDDFRETIRKKRELERELNSIMKGG